MKLSLIIMSLLLASACALPAVTVTGVRQVGYGGINNINGDEFWWMCFEPNGSGAPDPGENFQANILSLSAGWTTQNTERFTFFNAPSSASILANVPQQVGVMQYVLDTFLPWDTLAGASGKFTEQIAATSGVDPADTNPMYDALLAIQYFGSEMYGKVAKDDYTQFNDFVNPTWAGEGFSAQAITARNGIYQDILNDVMLQAQTPGFFTSYTPEHTYFITNSFFSESDPLNWQDGIVIGTVPEPSGALLIGAVGLLVTIRRARKRLAAAS